MELTRNGDRGVTAFAFDGRAYPIWVDAAVGVMDRQRIISGEAALDQGQDSAVPR